MNNRVTWVAVWLWAGMGWGGFAAWAAEHLYDDFNAYPTGSIAAQPGWVRYPAVVSTTGRVSDALSLVSSNALELTYHVNGCSAAFTNFNAVYASTNHPVIRLSADLYLSNTNVPFQLGLRNSHNGAFLTFQNLGGWGVCGFNYRDNVFVPLKQSMVMNVTLFYNMNTREFALDYGHSNVLNWVDSQYEANSMVIQTQFNQFVATRFSNTADHAAATVIIDNVTVETFPRHVLAWWRFNDTGGAFVEQLGQVQPTLREGNSDVVRGPAADVVFDGERYFHNSTALRRIIAGPAAMRKNSPVFTNWTVEAVFRTAPEDSNLQFIDWGTSRGFDTSGCWLGFSYRPALGNFRFSLRDADGGTNTEYINTTIGQLTPDTRWHTIAFVKSNSLLTLYVDYQFAESINLPASADGAFQFTTASHVKIGETLSSGNTMDSNSVLDELRFSTEALHYPTMLQPGQPLILELDGSPDLPPWRFITKGVLGWTCVLERADGLLQNPVWTPLSNFPVTTTFSAVTIPTNQPVSAPVFRIRRQ